jgi:hypothetical protein
MRRNRGEHGSGLIEFIFVAPIILLLAGSTLEVARFLRFRQIAGVLSQEAANRAYSQCADITSVSAAGTSLTVNSTTTTTNITNCLTTIKTAIETAADAAGLQAGRALTLSVYRHNLGTVAPALICPSATNAVTLILSAGPASKFTTTDGEIIAGGQTLINVEHVCKRGRIVIAELVFPYTTIINYRVFGLGFNTNLKQSGFERNDFRETTIL